MSQDLMHYDQMTQLALRSVVRDAIRRVIREDGLPGAHHFYITFLTRFPGVQIDEALAQKYPEEITIVLEHQYWDLNAKDDHFEVTLKFGGVPKYLFIPYTAVTRFHDPSVGFALQFDVPENMQTAAPVLTEIKPAEGKATKPTSKPDESQSAEVTPMVKPKKEKAAAKSKSKVTNKTDAKAKPKTQSSTKSKDTDDKTTETHNKETSTVVSLDAFRKK